MTARNSFYPHKELRIVLVFPEFFFVGRNDKNEIDKRNKSEPASTGNEIHDGNPWITSEINSMQACKSKRNRECKNCSNQFFFMKS